MEAVLTTPSGRITLGKTVVKIGSDSSNQLILDDPLAAPVHAEITLAEDGYQLTDLGSPRGVLINGQFLFPHMPQYLQNGDVIVIGKSDLTYREVTAEANKSASDLQTGLADIADQPTDVAIPAQPKAATRVLSPEPGGAAADVPIMPVETASAMSAEIAPALAPVVEPEHAVPLTPQPGVSTPALPLTPVSGTLAPFPVPQTPAAPIYAAPGVAGYPAFSALPPAGAVPGLPVQPGYPAGYPMGAYAYAPGQFQAVTGASVKPPTAQRREKILRWSVAIIVVLLLLGASNIGTYALARATAPKPVVHTLVHPSPQKVLQAYCQGILTGNSQEIYDQLSDEAKVHTSLDDIQKLFDELKMLNNSSSGSFNAQYSNCGFDDIRTSNSLAVATVLLSITLTIQIDSQGQKQSETTTETVPSLTSMVWEHNEWKIDVSSLSQQQPRLN